LRLSFKISGDEAGRWRYRATHLVCFGIGTCIAPRMKANIDSKGRVARGGVRLFSSLPAVVSFRKQDC